MTFFVKYNGDLEKDPLDRGVEDFADYESAFEFAKRMTNKGLATTIYSGTIVDEREKAFDELVRQSEEMGFYKAMEEDREVPKGLKKGIVDIVSQGEGTTRLGVDK